MAFKAEIDLSELTVFENRFEDASANAKKHITDMLNIIGYTMQADAIEMIINGPARHGKKYKRGGKESQRSAWGEPAKQDTGILQSSLDVQLLGSSSVKIGYLQSVAPYGDELEDPAKLNRPVLSTAKNQNITFIRAQIRRTVNNIIKL